MKDESDASGVQADWEPSYIPEGFKLSGTKTKDGVLFHRTYSDGMNSVTVQIRPIPENMNVGHSVRNNGWPNDHCFS